MKHQEGQKKFKKCTGAVGIDTRSFNSRVNSKLRMVEQYSQPNYPIPSLTDIDDHLNENWNPQSLIDICDTFFTTWELMYTGSNGLRYKSFTFENDRNEVVCDEICSSNSEDLSSIFKWANGHAITDNVRKAYWLNSTFGQCNSMSEGLMETIAVIKRRLEIKEIFYDSIRLSLETLKIRGFSLKSNFGSRKCVTGQETMLEQHHDYESHNHVALTMMGLDDKVEYVIDLTGLQFGVYGTDILRPQLVCEPLKTWRARFNFCIDDEPKYQYNAKRKLLESLARIVTEEKISFEGDRNAAISQSKPRSKEVDEAACNAADEAMNRLLLEEDEDTSKASKNKNKSKAKSK